MFLIPAHKLEAEYLPTRGHLILYAPGEVNYDILDIYFKPDSHWLGALRFHLRGYDYGRRYIQVMKHY